jgi:hypothetical protein
MAHGTWHMAHGTWHMAHGTWHMAHGTSILSVFRLGMDSILDSMTSVAMRKKFCVYFFSPREAQIKSLWLEQMVEPK